MKKDDEKKEQAFFSILGSFGVILRYLDYQLRNYGTRPNRFAILDQLDKQGGNSTPIELSDLLFISPPSITSTVNTLEKEGLVKRENETESDGRSIRIVITPDGQKLLNKIKPVMNDAMQTVMSSWSMETVDKIEGNLLESKKRLMKYTGSPRTWRKKKRLY